MAGLPDAAVREARDRVKAAITNAGYDFPRTRVTVNLAPAGLRKEGGAYDLPIAVAILSAMGQVNVPRTADHLVVGELSLDGGVRPVRGTLCIADAAPRLGAWKGLVVPAGNGPEAALAGHTPVTAVRSLGQAVRFLSGDWSPPPATAARANRSKDLPHPDFSDIRGQPGAVRAALIAAAGGHNLLFCGPPGSGKTMVAERLAGLLPPPPRREHIEVVKVYSVAGLQEPPPGGRPFRAPHHTVSAAGLLGGGPRAAPGEITLAHHGVLFLDELPEFDRRALEGLREPLERGRVVVARASYRVTFPSRFLLVGAMNPCPCGRHGVEGRLCSCSPGQVLRYRARISGPLLDRFDLRVDVPPVKAADLGTATTAAPSTAALSRRVAAARALQDARGVENGALAMKALERWAPLGKDAVTLLERAAERLGLSGRGIVRVRRVARTVADLAQSDAVTREHLAEAISFRTGDGAA